DGIGGPVEGMAASNRGQLRMLALDLDGTREWATRAMTLGAGDDARAAEEGRVHALNKLGTVEGGDGGAERGGARVEESLRRSQAADLHEHAARALTNLAFQAVARRDHVRAGAHLAVGLRYCLERDLDAWVIYMRGSQAQSRLDQGDHAEAAVGAEAV